MLIHPMISIRKGDMTSPTTEKRLLEVKSVKLVYFFYIHPLLYIWANIIKLSIYIVIITKETSTKTVIFMTPGSCAGAI